MSLRRPNLTQKCRAYEPLYLVPDMRLCRIFRHDHGHEALDWNPLVPLGEEGGRFDATPADQFRYLYGAVATESAAVAVWETLVPLTKWSKFRSGKKQMLPQAELACRSIQFFRVDRLLGLVDLNTPEGRLRMNAPIEVFIERKRSCTRLWGSYFRRHAEEAKGLCYNSSTLGARTPQSSFVLYEDRCPSLSFVPDSDPIPLLASVGLFEVQRYLDVAGVTVV